MSRNEYCANMILFCFKSFQANGQAALGKYDGGVAGAATADSLYVSNHAY